MAAPVYTASTGCPVMNPQASQRVGTNGPLLLQDFHLIDLLAHFDRERIPERVVHAKGAGAYGEFEVTDDLTDLTSAAMFNEVGKKTKVLVRFSTVAGEKGAADTLRDPRGFATKFYTEEGNLDWVFNNTPIFFIRDGAKFPQFIHTQKRNPRTNLKDANMFWDFLSSNPETAHQILHAFSDRGTPASYQCMNGYSGHTYKFTKPDGSFTYVQIHIKTDQGNKTMSNDEAAAMASTNPDYLTEELFNSIENGDFPSWTVYVQTMTPEQAEKFRYSVLDITKVWPQKEFPLRRFGKLTLNRNANNYFAEIEQVAFSPSHMVPGIEPSADPLLQARLFSYPDTHRHRLGSNYDQIPCNQPLPGVAFSPFNRDGYMNVTGNYGAEPNYQSSSRPLTYKNVAWSESHEKWIGAATNFASTPEDLDYEQATALWEVLGRQPGQQDALVYNVSVHLCQARSEIRERVYVMFGKIDSTLGARIKEETEKKA